MKVFLEVEKGENRGERFRLEVNRYRTIGRADHGAHTLQLTLDGDVALDEEELERVARHIQRRRGHMVAASDSRNGSAYRRGPDILLNDAKVSRTHCMLFVDEQGASVVDLMSTNGVMVNGERVSEADLSEGDIMHVGKSRCVVRVE